MGNFLRSNAVRLDDSVEEQNVDRVDEKTWEMEKFTHEHTLSIASLRAIADKALLELQRGLKGEASSFSMLESHVRSIPKGSEKGTFYAFDLGGQNLRVIRVLLKGEGAADIKVHKTKVPESLMAKEATAEQLFGFVADNAKTACEEFKDMERKEDLPVGFTFSFPIKQSGLNKATLLKWTKSFQTSGCIGEDVGVLMQQALQERKIPLRVDAICNDTVGTLVACALEHRTCKIGVILGTGCNTAYFEPETGSIINIESGAFDKGLPCTDVDRSIDEKSVNPGSQRLEKLTSGMYLGEMVMKNFQKIRPDLDIPEKVVVEFSGFETNKIVRDTTPDLRITQEVLQEFGLENFTLQDKFDLQHVTEMILNRSADLSAATLLAILKKMGETGKNKITVGIDGSVYKLDPHYKLRIKYTLDRLLGFEDNKVVIVDTEDGSGKGAALVVAACAPKASYL